MCPPIDAESVRYISVAEVRWWCLKTCWNKYRKKKIKVREREKRWKNNILGIVSKLVSHNTRSRSVYDHLYSPHQPWQLHELCTRAQNWNTLMQIRDLAVCWIWVNAPRATLHNTEPKAVLPNVSKKDKVGTLRWRQVRFIEWQEKHWSQSNRK